MLVTDVTQKPRFDLESVENIAGKGEKGEPAFSGFPTMFSKALFCRVSKILDCVVKG